MREIVPADGVDRDHSLAVVLSHEQERGVHS
jgi:hypothetical protein